MKHVRLPRGGGKTTILLDAVDIFLGDTENRSWAFIVVPDNSQMKYLQRRVESCFKPFWKYYRVKIYTVAAFRNQTLGFANVGVFIDDLDMMLNDEGLINILTHKVFPVILTTETGSEKFWTDKEEVPVNYDLICIWCGEELSSPEDLETHEAGHD